MTNYLVYARKNWLVISGLVLVIILLVILMTNFLIPGQDWSNSFRPAVYNLLTGRSLYHLEKGIAASWEPISFLNPP
jgi:hypothetical protein